MALTRRIIHVNERDEVLGIITPAERTDDHIYRVSSLWLKNPAGKILIAQRHPRLSNHGGLWGPAVAGTVEAGESYLDNIRKEAREEIGLAGVDFQEGPKLFVDRHHHGRTYFCQWFFATTDQPAGAFKLEADEVSAVRWVSEPHLKAELLQHPESFVPSAHRWIGRFI